MMISVYGQGGLIISKESYSYQIQSLDDYSIAASIEGFNISQNSIQFSIPVSELSEKTSIETLEYNGKKWKTSKIGQSETVSTIDHSSFFSGYKYLRYQIEPGTHFRFNITSNEKHTLFLAQIGKYGNYAQKSKTRYEFNLPADLSLTTQNGETYTNQVVFEQEQFDTLENIYFSIHPKSTSPTDYFSEWFSERIEPQLLIKDSLLPKSLLNLKGKVSDSIFAVACFEFVKREIRYIDIENGINAIVPRHCEKVLSEQLGDCKDMATLLTAIYRKFGFEAYPAISQTNQIESSFNFPSIALANHMICVLKLGDQLVYLDPTENGCLFGDPSLQIFGTSAFLIGHKPTYFHIIPSEPQSKSFSSLSYTIDGETEKISLTIKAHGKMNLMFNYIDFSYKSPETYIEKVLLNLSHSAWQADSVSILDTASYISLSIPFQPIMHSAIKNKSLYNPSTFLLSMDAMLAIFQNNAYPLFKSNLIISLTFSGRIEPKTFTNVPIVKSIEENSIIFECPLIPVKEGNKYEEDTTYRLWHQILTNPIIVYHEN